MGVDLDDPGSPTPPGGAGGGGTPAIAPEVLAMFAQQGETLRILAQMMAGLPQHTAPPQAAAPSIIQVMPAQSDVKRVALMRVQAILQLFDPSLRALAWRVSDADHTGAPQAYDMERATERVREIITVRGGRLINPPSKAFLTNVSLLLFDYGSDGLSFEDFNTTTVKGAKKIGESWERFTQAYMYMSYVLREYVSASLGSSLDSLYVNLVNIHVKYPRLRTSALLHLTQRMLGKLRSLESMPDHPSVIAEVSGLLQVSETSAEFQEVFNQEVMGDFEGLGKRKEEDLTPPQAAKKPRAGAVPTRPALQGATPCYSWIKELPCCKGSTCNAKKKKGVYPHKFDPIDRGAPEKEFRDWVKKYM
jgi:hypothetical protein